MKKKVYIILVVIFLIIVCTVIGVTLWYKEGQKAPSNTSNQEKIVEIQSGTSTTNIYVQLKEENVIQELNESKIR